MRIARRASLAYFHPRRFAGRYRRNRRHSAAPDDPVLMFSRDRRISSRPVICRRNSSAFSKRPSFIFLFMEIIQLVAINVHDKAQHIVDQSRKPCAFIPQQVEDFRHFALGLRTDIDRRAVTAIHRREERAFEIRQRDLFTPESGRLLSSSRLDVDVCFLSSRCRCSGYRFRCVFLRSVRIFLFRFGNPGGRLSNPKGPVRRSSDASTPRRLRYGDV